MRATASGQQASSCDCFRRSRGVPYVVFKSQLNGCRLEHSLGLLYCSASCTPVLEHACIPLGCVQTDATEMYLVFVIL
jgi:hypothetical protein